MRTASAIAITAHEVRHTLQYKEMGVMRFLLKYTWQGIRALGDPYRMPLERAGHGDQDAVRGLLEANPRLPGQIQSGSYVRVTMQPSSSAWFGVDRSNPGVYGALTDLFGFGGNLFIDGANVTGVFNAAYWRY